MDTKFNVTVLVSSDKELDELHKLAGIKNEVGDGFCYPAWYNVFIGEWTCEGEKGYQSLQQFKEQGIMKYSEGDVLVYGTDTSINITVAVSVCGVYIITDMSGDPYLYSDKELERKGYTLKTEITKTDKTVAQIEKDLNLPAGSLNVVAE